MKCIFSIKVRKIINNFNALINIDKASFSRLTKINCIWSTKRSENIIENICFPNSISLITSITTFGYFLAASTTGLINSLKFMKY